MHHFENQSQEGKEYIPSVRTNRAPHEHLFIYSLMRRHRGFFVDLFVRVSNAVAIGMYKKVKENPKSPKTLSVSYQSPVTLTTFP